MKQINDNAFGKTVQIDEEKGPLEVLATTIPKLRKSFDRAKVRFTLISKQQRPLNGVKIL